MKYLIIAILIVILAVICILLGFFKMAFVKKNVKGSGMYDMNLTNYKNEIAKGIKFFDEAPHTKMGITSFDGLKLSANFYSNENARGTIMLVHGYRSYAKRDFSCASEFYYDLGFNLLLIDQRCSGDSEGRLITFGIKERRDIIDWIKHLNKEIGEDTPIFVSGLSMGATSVLMASGLGFPPNVKGFIADSGFTSPPDIMADVAKKMFKINAKPFLPLLNLLCKIFGKFSIYETTTIESVKKNTTPILFIHGENDGFVPCDMTLLAYDAATADKYLVTVPNADHGLAFVIDRETTSKALIDFVEKYI